MNPLTPRANVVHLDTAPTVRRPGSALRVTASPEVGSVLATVGRTEDVVVSPDGRHVAIAGFLASDVLLARVRHDTERGELAVESVLVVHALQLVNPHGLDFLDARTLVVANRSAELVTLHLPDALDAPLPPAFGEAGPAVGQITVPAHVLLDGASPVPVRTPGSVAVRRLAEGLAHIYVCNNYAHDVTRYVAVRNGAHWEVVTGEVLLRAGLAIPDGITVSPCGRWLAVSNHDTHEVFTYRLDDTLGPTSEPAGRLRGINYPHGLRFTADSRRLVVADAGLPYIAVFEAPTWDRALEPSAVVRVMDDDVYRRGRYNPQEGGPKGLALLPRGIALVTSEHQALAAFDLGADRSTGELAPPVPERGEVASIVQRLHTEVTAVRSQLAATVAERDAARAAADTSTTDAAQLQAVRDELARVQAELADLRSRAAADAAARVTAEAERATAEAERAAAQSRADTLTNQLAQLRESTAWRATAPARAAADALRRRRRSPG